MADWAQDDPERETGRSVRSKKKEGVENGTSWTTGFRKQAGSRQEAAACSSSKMFALYKNANTYILR